MVITSYQLLFWWGLTCSTVSLVIMGVDKHAAKSGTQRIRERVLLLTAFLGGWPGMLVGMKLFNHKHQKTLFNIKFTMLIAANTCVVAVLLIFIHSTKPML